MCDYRPVCVCVHTRVCVCVCVFVYLRGRGRWKGRRESRPLLLHSWCKSAGLGALASHWVNTSPPLRNTQSHITMTTTWTHTHTHTSVQGPLCGIHHSTSGETRKQKNSQTLTNAIFLVPVEFLSRRTHTLIAALGVNTAMLTAPVADAALINVWEPTTESRTVSMRV